MWGWILTWKPFCPEWETKLWRVSRFSLPWEVRDAVPVCYVVICPGLMQAFRTLLREAQAEAVTLITGPRVSIFQNIVTSVLHLSLLWPTSSMPSLAFILILCWVIFPPLFQFSVFYLLFPATHWNKNTIILFDFFFSFPFFHLLSSLSSFFLIFISFWHLRLHNSIDWVNFEILVSLFSI